jgi:hypothetical protein
MQFHDVYTVQPGDSLSKIGHRKGFRNPGPIFAYPPNQGFFKGRSPDLIRPKERFLIPWLPDKLQKFITWQDALIQDVKVLANKMIKEELTKKEELEDLMMKLDAITMVACFFVAVGFAAREGTVVLAEKMPAAAEEAAKAAAKQSAEIDSKMVEYFADTHFHLAADITLMSAPPEPSTSDWKFYARHAFGMWTPSYWGSVAGAVRAGDVGVYLYGSEWTQYKNAQNIANNAKLAIIKAQAPIMHARCQLAMPFYRTRI